MQVAMKYVQMYMLHEQEMYILRMFPNYGFFNMDTNQNRGFI